MQIFKNILLYIWQLPQNLLGLLLLLFYRTEKKLISSNGNIVYFSKQIGGGISLGKYSLINSYYVEDTDELTLASNVVKHEALGHGTQSRYLGPLYLLIIGIPSFIWAILYGWIIPYTRNGYYRFYTEKSADRLGGVIRK